MFKPPSVSRSSSTYSQLLSVRPAPAVAEPYPREAGTAPAGARRRRAIYSYLFILTNLDVTAPDTADAVECWHQHGTDLDRQRAPRQQDRSRSPTPAQQSSRGGHRSGCGGALIATSIAARLPQLPAVGEAPTDLRWPTDQHSRPHHPPWSRRVPETPTAAIHA